MIYLKCCQAHLGLLFTTQSIINQIKPFLIILILVEQIVFVGINKMIQKRREIFTKSIRRKQLNAIFKELRICLLDPLPFQDYIRLFHSTHLGRTVAGLAQKIRIDLHLKNYLQIQNSFEQILKLLKENPFQVSAFLILCSSQICQFMNKVIVNEDGAMDQQHNQWKELDANTQINMIECLLKMLEHMIYRSIGENQFKRVLASLWYIFSNSKITIFHGQFKQISTLLLKVFKSMLKSQNKIVFSSLKSQGIAFSINNIVQYNIDSLVSLDVQLLMEIIYYYTSLDNQLQSTNNLLNKINAAQIMSLQVGQKQIMMAFCLYTINTKMQNLYYFSICSLLNIFQRHKYLVHSMNPQYIKQICLILCLPNEKNRSKTLQLIDDIVYNDSQKANALLQDDFLPNLILKLLVDSKNSCVSTIKQLSHISSNILINLTFCPNISQFIKHPIWEFAYQNIQNDSPYLPLVSIFQYYFLIIPKKMAINLLQNYLYCIGLLDMEYLDKRQSEDIKGTLVKLYKRCLENWPQDYEIRFRDMIDQNNLRYILEEYMQIEDEKGNYQI